jgi:dolichol-phosphate mannosyltransferase
MPGISLVVPAYNEQEVIAQAVGEADAALSSLTRSSLIGDYEILVVDDGSRDATAEILDELTGQFARLRVLRQPKNLGYGAALRRGFEAATKELVSFTDADCQFELSELERLVLLARDYDIVCGYRIDRQDSFLRCFYSNIYNTLVRTLLGTRVRDCDCALKLFHRETLSLLPIRTDGFLVNGEMLTQARQQDLTVVEVGVTHRPRAAGTSKVSVTHIPVVLAALVRYWWNSVLFPNTAVPQDLGEWSSTRRWQMSLLLMVLASVVLFTNLNYSLFEPDETRYAQIGLEMFETGDWVVPRLGGEPYLDKPPLLYWLTASSYSLFGASQQSARLPGAVAALLTILACYVLGRRLIGDGAAWIGALLLLLSSGFILSGRFLMMDGLLTLFTTVGLLSAAVALHARVGMVLVWWLITGVACGLGILTKGPIAAVVCLPPMLAAAWLTKNSRRLCWQVALALALPMMLIAIPWFILISFNQQNFSNHFFWTHHIQRFLSAFNHSEPWWFYLPVLAIGLLPASLLSPAFAMYLFGRGKKFRSVGVHDEPLRFARTQQLGAILLAGGWVVLFFSMSSCKLPAYILPAMPMFCLAMGKMLQDVLWSTRVIPIIQQSTHRALERAVLLTACMMVVAVVGDLVLKPTSLVVTTLAFLLVPGLAWVVWKKGDRLSVRHAWLATAMLCLVVSMYGFDRVIPRIASWRSLSRTAATLRHQLGEEVPVVFFGRQPHSATFSIPRGDVAEFAGDQVDGFRQFMDQHAVAVVITDRHYADRIREDCGQSVDLQGPAARGRVYVAESTVSTDARVGQHTGRNLK